MKYTHKISIAIPIYDMKNADFFLSRLLDSLKIQTFRDFQIVITKNGKMAENTNSAIKKCTGELIKILYMDDFLAHENSLQEIVDNFKGGWLVTGCEHDAGLGRFNPHYPSFNPDISANLIGSPSVLTVKNEEDILLFDETMTWLLDVDYYKRLYKRYGMPVFLNSLGTVIGIGEHQMTNILSDELKQQELDYLIKKHD